MNSNGFFLEEVNRKFFLALRYWVTFTLPAVVPRHTVYRLRPLCPRVAGWIGSCALRDLLRLCTRHDRHRVTGNFGLYKPPSLPAQCRASAVTIFRNLSPGSEVTLACPPLCWRKRQGFFLLVLDRICMCSFFFNDAASNRDCIASNDYVVVNYEPVRT